MVSTDVIEQQLKKIGFNYRGWGRTEVKELQHIILPDEEIYECVNGIYEGGFALLLATDVRVLLIDKKPLNYLTVEDVRFDMINEIDYNHRLFGAYIAISTGSKNLKFTSINQPRLRKLIGHVQRCMAESKNKQSDHQETQNQHLERINQQLQSYLLAQYQQQQKLHEQLEQVQAGQTVPSSQPALEPIRPAPELADYLYAQGLLAQHQARIGQVNTPTPSAAVPAGWPADQTAEIYSEGVREVFGPQSQTSVAMIVPLPEPSASPRSHATQTLTSALNTVQHSLDVNPLRVAYAKLPLILSHRKFSHLPFRVSVPPKPEVLGQPPAASASPVQ